MPGAWALGRRLNLGRVFSCQIPVGRAVEARNPCYTAPSGCGLSCSPSPARRLHRGNGTVRSKKPFSAGKPTFVIFMALLLTSAIVPAPAQARKFKVLHTLHGANGNGPVGVLTTDSAGNLYGTTSGGGVGKCGKFSCGTAFKLNKAGKQIWLHSFTAPRSWDPSAGLLRDGAGNLYGTTDLGGDTGCYSLGCGTVFKLDSRGKETVLHRFTGQPDGEFPVSLLVKDSSGDLCGTTYSGGANGLGSIFKVTKTGKETVMYSFSGGSDGCAPIPGVITDCCRPTRMGAGRKRCFMNSAPSPVAPMGSSRREDRWFGTQQETCTAPRSSAARRGIALESAAGLSSS
jgi:uncharacterized repeat protein (TIGR03803 family)